MVRNDSKYSGIIDSKGMRQACTVFIELDIEKALKDGMELFLTKNNVIQTKGFDGVIPTVIISSDNPS